MKNYLLLFWRKTSLLWLLGVSLYSPSLRAQFKKAATQPVASQTTTAQARVAAATAIAPDQPFSMILMSDTQLPWWRGARDADCKSDACVEQQAKRTNLNMLTSVNAIGNMGTWPTGSTRKNDITRLSQAPSGVIINGDLTAYFHPDQYNMYKEFWDAGRTTRPIYPGLGNHDYSNNTPQLADCSSASCTGGTYGLYFPDYWRNAKEAVWYMANKMLDGSIPNIVNRDLGGYVSLHNVAAFNARLTVSYLLNGQLVSRTSDGFESGQWRAFPVPRGATQVSMTIEKNNGIRWVTVASSTNLLVTRNCFKVQGTLSNDSFTSDDCRREWPTGSEGSLSYSFDINNYHFVQLHLEPSYEKDMIERPLSNLTVAAYNPGKSPGFKITKSIAWLKADLDNATAQGKRIVLNMHTDYVGIFGDSTQRDANSTAFYDAIAYQNVVAVFSGHLHEQYGYEYSSNNNGRNHNIQWFKTGSTECERFLYAEFHDSYFNIGVVKTEGGMPTFVTSPGDLCPIMTNANFASPIDRTVRWLRTELVTSHPSSQTYCTGVAARFSAQTTADATRFQWQLDANTGRFEDIAATDTRFTGITSATLTIPTPTTALAGFRFRIRVQNEAGTLSTSDAATLSFRSTPPSLSIVSQPLASLGACPGGRTTVSVGVTGGSSDNSYQWYLNNVAVASATTTVLSLTNLQVANAGNYQLVVQVPNCPISVTSSIFSLSINSKPARVYVNDDASGANTGQNWANAYRDLQSALIACPAGEVWVAKGLYKPTKTTDRLISFVVPPGTAIYGGFAGTETLLSQRNLRANPTVLSGDIDNNDTDRFGVAYLDRAADIVGNNSRHVVTLASSTTAQSRLDGLIITAGKAEANASNELQSGAGIYTKATSSTLANCWITGNFAFNGAGLYTDGPQLFPLLVNCNFTGNTATNGGAIASWQPTMVNCTIYNNQATSTGGGVYVGSGLSLQNTIIWGNTASTSPGIFGSFTATYSDIQNTTPTGTGNKSIDPQLNTIIGAHIPVACSPVVNAGNPATSTALVGTTDIQSLARIVGGRIDMGAYEAVNPPGITQQPGSGTAVCAGASVTVSVGTAGGTFQYQWYRNGVALTGVASATTANLTFPNVQSANTGTYIVTAIGTCGSFTSTPFNLSISTPVAIESFTTASFSGCASNLNITLQVPVTGTVSSYQWYQNGTALAGANSFSLGLPNAQSVNSGTYVLVAIGPCNSVTAVVVNLTITAGAKIYVNANANGANNGTSWTNAYRNLQSALQDPKVSSCSAAEIWVAKGIYKPTTTTDRTLSFSIRNGVAVYGGFAGTETALSQRNLRTNPTVLSGDIDNNDTNTDGNSIVESSTAIQGNNSYHVVTIADNAQVRLDGLIITAGQANGTSVHLQGGGIYTYSASGVTLANCRFQGNTSTDGGGMYTFASNLTVINSSFAGNQAGYGAAIVNRNGTTHLINCSLGNNQATTSSGALYANTGSFSITNSIIWGNTIPSITGSFTATYSDIQSLTTGTGNIQSDPLFVDATSGNLALQANSPVINLGNPATTTAQIGSTDLNSNPRIVNTRIDMGAYEFQGNVGPIFTVKTGNWNDPTVWSVGYVPGAGEAVELRHAVTVTAGYLATCLRMTFALGGRITYGLASKLKIGF